METASVRTPEELEARSLALHRLVAARLRERPELFARVRATLDAWQTRVAPASMPYVECWQQLAAQGMEAALAVAVEESPRADTLRQCSPFSGILSHAERFGFLKTWSTEHASRRA